MTCTDFGKCPLYAPDISDSEHFVSDCTVLILIQEVIDKQQQYNIQVLLT